MSEFANFNYINIYTQIILSLSDLGIKYSYFRSSKLKNKSNLYFIISKLIISICLYFLIFIIFKESGSRNIYFNLLPFIIGSAIFPTFLYQNYKMYTFIGLSNLVTRLIPLFFLSFTSDIGSYGLLMGIIILLNSLISLYVFRKIILIKIKFINVVIFIKKLFEKNAFLNVINLTSLIEINFQSLISKFILNSHDFELFIYTERIVAIFKQMIITIFDFLYPKINQSTNRLFSIIKNTFIVIYISLLVVFYLNSKFVLNNSFLNFDLSSEDKLFVFVFLLFPVFILQYNFIENIVFIKNKYDKENFFLQLLQICIKAILIILTYKYFGLVIIPITLIAIELIAGTYKKRMNLKYNSLI